jgi:hypothetical protein
VVPRRARIEGSFACESLNSRLDSNKEEKKDHLIRNGHRVLVALILYSPDHHPATKKEFFIDNLLVRIHSIIEMIFVDRPCAMGVLTLPPTLRIVRTESGRARLGRRQKALCRTRTLGYFGLDPPQRGSHLVRNKLISRQNDETTPHNL